MIRSGLNQLSNMSDLGFRSPPQAWSSPDATDPVPSRAESRKQIETVTFALLAYNQEKYIGAAIEGALSQTFEPLEIILSDDRSSDETFEIMRRLAREYNGPHSIKVRQNSVNLGLSSHLNAVIKESTSDVIILAAGDDISAPTRSTLTMNLFNRHPGAVSVLLSGKVLHEDGTQSYRNINPKSRKDTLQDLQSMLRRKHVNFGPTRAIRKEVFEVFGDLNSDCPTEDTTLLLRSLILGKVVLSASQGVTYRKHTKSLSSTSSMLSMDTRAIIRQYEIDLARAVSLNLLRDSEIAGLHSWIEVESKDRELRLKLLKRQGLTLADFLFAWREPTFRIAKKLKITLSSISHAIHHLKTLRWSGN